MKKIHVYPADMEGCGYFRIIWPGKEVAKNRDLDVQIIPPNQREGSFSATMHGDQVVDVHMPGNPDVVVLQRVTHAHLAQCVKVLRQKGVVVIIDIDDNLAAIHPQHPAWSWLHPRKNPDNKNVAYQLNSWHNIEIACRDASWVTVSSDELLGKYAKHGRGSVLRNYLPEGYLKIERAPDNVFGWGGSLKSHPDDPQVTGTSIRQLEKDGHHFRVIGPVGGLKEALRLNEDPDATGPVKFEDWPHAISQLRVGMAPLADTLFNRCKSDLKPLEYAGLGIPCVMSPRREYRRLHKETGIGFMAKSGQEWYRHIKRLMEDDVFCDESGFMAREAAAKLTIEQHAWRWREVWETTPA